MTPTRTNILFKPFPSEEKINGLFVPESVREVNDKGTIVSVGEMAKLKVGTIAHRVHKWGEEFIVDGESHFLMDEKAILAIE